MLEGLLYAVDTANGTERWRYAMAGQIEDRPALDAAGNVFLGSAGKDLVGLTPAGQVMTHLRMDDEIWHCTFRSRNRIPKSKMPAI